MFQYSLHIPPHQFDLALCVSSGQVFRWQPVGAQWVGVDGQNWFRVSAEPEGRFDITSNASKNEFLSLFRLTEDLGKTKSILIERGVELKPYIEALPGLRLLQPTDPCEVLFCFLCTANNHLSRITQMVRKLAAYGEQVAEVDGFAVTRFPSAERIASISEADLRTQGFGYRAATIPHVAREIVIRGEGWLRNLKKCSFSEARKELLTLKSVGPKLADCICLYGLHKTEATPMDTHLWQAMTRLYFPEWKEKPLTLARYSMAAEFMRNRFGEYAGLAHLFLYFENLQNWRSRGAESSPVYV